MLKESFVNMIYCVLTFIFAIETVFSIQPEEFALTLKLCNYGDMVENICIRCVCTTEGLYSCELKDCVAVQEIYFKVTEACEPNRVYREGPTKCICTTEGQWPHKQCYDHFRYLPKDTITKRTCEPQGYVKVDCNICRCNDDGEIDSTRCTVNECDTVHHKYRKNIEGTKPSVFGQCQVKNWYSLGPCQFCYCVDTNKLMCTTSVVPTQNRQGQMTLGPGTLTWCGPGLLKEIAALVPSQKFKMLRAALSNEELNNENADIPTNQYIEEIAKNDNDKEITETRPGPEDGQLEMAYDEEDKGNGNENKNDVKIDIAASFDGIRRLNKPSNYDTDAVSELLDVRRLLSISRKKCKPGKPITVKCNICHCLKNGKMICSNNKCN